MDVLFYCTRCGVRLRLEDRFAGARVSCPQCTAVVRTPVVPVATVAADAVDALAEAVRESADGYGQREGSGDVLSYAPANVRRPGLSPTVVADIAARLASVEPGDANEDGSMSNCPYCDSTIAPFLGKCPFCRHPLRGR